jgi:hypothetical protein
MLVHKGCCNICLNSNGPPSAACTFVDLREYLFAMSLMPGPFGPQALGGRGLRRSEARLLRMNGGGSNRSFQNGGCENGAGSNGAEYAKIRQGGVGAPSW